MMRSISKILEDMAQIEEQIDENLKALGVLKELQEKGYTNRRTLQAELESHQEEGLPERWVVCGKKVVHLRHEIGYAQTQVDIYDAEVEADETQGDGDDPLT